MQALQHTQANRRAIPLGDHGFAVSLMEHLIVPTFVIGADAKVLIWNKACERLTGLPAAEVVNPIACGDAMAAGIAWAVRDGRDMIDAFRLGMAASAENLRDLLPCRLDPARVQARAAEVSVREYK